MSPRAAALCALAAATPSLAAPAPAPPVFRAEAGVVTVDVVVTDGDGQPVRGLGRDDFVVYEDGAPQTLAVFEAIEAPEAAPAPAAEDVVATTPVAVSRPADPARPTLVVVFDEMHLSPASVEQVRRRLRDVWSAEGLGRADVLLASTAGGGTWQGSLPEGADALQAALLRFAGARPPAGTRRITDYEAFLIAARRDERVLIEVYRRYLNEGLLPDPTIPGMQPQRRGVRTDAQDTLPPMGRSTVQAEAEARWREVRGRQAGALHRLIRLLTGLAGSPGRKAVLLVSEGFLHDPALVEHRELAEAAREARATVHLLDPRNDGVLGHEAQAQDAIDTRDYSQAAMRQPMEAEGSVAIAQATGGRVIRTLPGLGNAMGAIAAELETYYVLGYAPPDAKADGRYHKLKVEVRREGVRIDARPGYYALAPLARRVAGQGATPALLTALDSPFDAAGLAVRLAGYVLGPVTSGGAVVRLVAEVDTDGLATTNSKPAVVDAVFQLMPRGRSTAQQKAVSSPVEAAQGPRLRLEARFEAPPGAYQARLVVRERGGTHQTGSVRQSLDVLPPEAFRITTPILSDVLGPHSVALARADRRFRQDSTLYCLAEVLGASASVQVGLDLRSPDGRVRRRIPAAPLTGAHLSRQWAIPLAELEPGPYELWISVSDTARGRGLQAREPFEVVADN